MSIPEVLSSHLTPSRQFGSLPFIPMRRGFSCSPCYFRWEKTQKATDSPCCTSDPRQPVCSYCEHLRKASKCSEKTTGSTSLCESLECNSHSKKREKEDGSFLRIMSNRVACRRLLTRTSFQNVMFAPKFEPGPPSRVSWALWQCYRGQAVRGGRGLCMDYSHHSYSSGCLRRLGWERGQTLSTLPSTFHLQEWLKVESSFWHRGVFSLAYSHRKSGLHLSVEVEVRGLTNACNTWVIDSCKWKTSFLSHKSHVCFTSLVLF